MLLPLQALRVEAVLTSPSAFTPLGLHLGKCSPCSSLPISDCNLSTVLKLCNIDYNVIASLDTYFLSLTKSAPTTVVSLTFLKPTGKPHPQGHSILPIPSAQHALKYLHCLIWSAPSWHTYTDELNNSWGYHWMQNDFIYWLFHLNYFIFKSNKKKILNKKIHLGLYMWHPSTYNWNKII